jgi:hypothetical protein
MINLDSLSLEDLTALKAKLDGLTDTSGRSPIRPRQLHDLRLVPTAADPRPTFYWSAESPRNAADLSKTTPYPRLMWESKTGREITVMSAAAQETYTAQGFILTPPANAEAPDPADVMRDMLEGLSEADRKLVLHGAHQARMEQIRDMLLQLSDAERAALAADMGSASDANAQAIAKAKRSA